MSRFDELIEELAEEYGLGMPIMVVMANFFMNKATCTECAYMDYKHGDVCFRYPKHKSIPYPDSHRCGEYVPRVDMESLSRRVKNARENADSDPIRFERGSLN